ncbi:hypothetical protein [Streptomyces canus]|uniref:hypothetical protein n=1 Tax=Streptomyces canus TaxID=58343 RepID=UPI00131A4822|nr:hypothetical protein [Streptomyces canus]
MPADDGTRTVRISAQSSDLSCPIETHPLGNRSPGPDSESAGQEGARSALRTALKTAGQAADRSLTAARTAARWLHDRCTGDAMDADDHELHRIVYRLSRYEEWAPARGLSGLRPVNGGFSFEGIDGLTLIRIRVRLDGALTFGALVDHADRLLAYLALSRGSVANVKDGHAINPYRLDREMIARGMLAVHRRRGSGSVLMIQAGHRADEAMVWIGQAGELRRVSRQIDAIQAEQAAQEQAEEAAKQARRTAERAAGGAARRSASLCTLEPPGPATAALSGSVPKPATVPSLIVDALKEGPATGAALVKRISRSRSEVYRALGQLAARGTVVQDERGGPYRLILDSRT